MFGHQKGREILLKRFLVFMIAFSLLCVTACGSNPYVCRYEPDRDLVKVETDGLVISYDEALADLPFEQMITKTCDIHEFMNYSCSSLDAVAAKIGVECLRVNDTGVYYSVHKVEQGGLLYVFYGRWTVRELGDQSVDHWYYVNKEHSYADFHGIEVGSTIRAVEAIDPAARLWHNEFLRSCTRTPTKAYDTFSSQHYLSDGVLTIHYKNTDDDPYDRKEGDFVVCDIEYTQDYGWWENGVWDDVSILSQDSVAYLGQLHPPKA